jgi:hypothetical protein
MHPGSVPTHGFDPADPGPKPDRGLGDFLTLALDASGRLVVAYEQGASPPPAG